MTINEFTRKTKEGKKVVDFGAEWCSPCRQLSALIDTLIAENPSYEHSIIKINVDECDEIIEQQGISSIPTLLFYSDGELVSRHVGTASKEVIQSFLQN